MEQIYYGIAFIVYAIFIIKFIMSWVGGDFELDGDLDLDISDVVSFKGLTHFLMGFFGWLSVKSYNTHCILWYDYLIALILGILFVFLLFYVYKFMLKLECKPTILNGKDLVGRRAMVYLCCGKNNNGEYKYTISLNAGTSIREFDAVSNHSFTVGEVVTILDYNGAYYLI